MMGRERLLNDFAHTLPTVEAAFGRQWPAMKFESLLSSQEKGATYS